ncbi:MAG: N-acetylmuramoyl-L-alanine amidase [Candidatus Firestonebacteria bacterium]|nr:N-acetylmuramoyl-L-alanine amidase [Candidatus Firestonebacteria bacterium]
MLPAARRFLGLGVFFFLAGWGAASPGFCASPDAGETTTPKIAVVVDPGHGGDDTGLKLSAAGPAEKEFALKVGQELRGLLARDARLSVWLTRTKDQAVSLNARQTLANAKNAQVFVSLHVCASGPGHPAVFIFTHRVSRDEALKTLVGRAQAGDVRTVPWDEAQAAMKSASRSLAKTLGQAWETGRESPAAEVRLQEVPLGGLTGVRAPAVLVEMPLPGAEGAKASEIAGRQAAKVLAAGIRDFLDRR